MPITSGKKVGCVLRRKSLQRMRSHEGNRFVPLWNHEISLVPMGDVCRYTDRVTIGAGWAHAVRAAVEPGLLPAQAEEMAKNIERRRPEM